MSILGIYVFLAVIGCACLLLMLLFGLDTVWQRRKHRRDVPS